MIWWLAACVDSTGGARVHFDAEARVRGQPHHHEGGWSITLEEGEVFVGPVYLWSEPPLLDVGRAPLPFPLWAGLAWAQDPFDAGFITGEVTTRIRLDLLRPGPVPLGEGLGFAGPSGSAELWLEPAGAEPTLRLAGTATEATEQGIGRQIRFLAEITWDEAWFDLPAGENPLVQRRVRGLPWEAELAEGGLLTVAVEPHKLLRGLDWGALAAQAPEDGVHRVLPGTQAGHVLRDRARETGPHRAWTLEWTPAEDRAP